MSGHRTPRRARATGCALALALVAALAACTGPAAEPTRADPVTTTSSSSADSSSAAVSAAALLAGLRTAAPDFSVPYDRTRFGYGEDFDPDGDGCFTRARC